MSHHRMEHHPLKGGFIYPLKIKVIEINPVYSPTPRLQLDLTWDQSETKPCVYFSSGRIIKQQIHIKHEQYFKFPFSCPHFSHHSVQTAAIFKSSFFLSSFLLFASFSLMIPANGLAFLRLYFQLHSPM